MERLVKTETLAHTIPNNFPNRRLPTQKSWGRAVPEYMITTHLLFCVSRIREERSINSLSTLCEIFIFENSIILSWNVLSTTQRSQKRYQNSVHPTWSCVVRWDCVIIARAGRHIARVPCSTETDPAFRYRRQSLGGQPIYHFGGGFPYDKGCLCDNIFGLFMMRFQTALTKLIMENSRQGKGHFSNASDQIPASANSAPLPELHSQVGFTQGQLFRFLGPVSEPNLLCVEVST